MNKYYQNELDTLRDLAAEFSKANPTIAPQLAAASTDPDVERILEGVAFLTSKIRQKIDDDFPEFSQGLLKQIFPHYLRQVPSATIVEFKPKPILKSKLSIPSSTYLDSDEVEGVSCRFKTVYDVDVSPIKVSQVKQTQTSTGKKAIELTLDLNGMAVNAWDSDNFRLHIGGDYTGAVDLFYLLQTNLEYMSVSGASGDEIVASTIKIVPIGFDNSHALLDYPANSFPAYRLIQEYFLMKEKFLFIEISDLKRFTSQLTGNKVTLHFYFNESVTQIPRLTPSRFILHATPAVNLFKHEAESILNDHKRHEYRVRPLRDTGNRYHIFNVDKVVGRDRKSSEMNEYKEIGLTDPEMNSVPVYQVTTRQAAEGSAPETYIGFSYPKEYSLEKQETILINLTCSNGSLPSQLKPGDISRPTSGSSEMVEFSNLLQPSDMQEAPSGSSMLWRLLSHLSLNYLSLADTDNFKSLLGLYIFSNGAGNKQEVANKKRLDGIEGIKVEPCDRLIGGVPMRGQAVTVDANPAKFASKGDMYLFGMLVDHLFGSFSSINSFTEFSLRDTSSDEEISWPAKTGDKPLL